MLNVNTNFLEWTQGESLDGRKLSPEERSSRGWEFATSFGTLVLIGSGLKLPGGAAVAESMAGRSAMSRILRTPIEGVIAGSARSAAGAVSAAGSALGRAVLRNPRIVALQLRLEAVLSRMTSNGASGLSRLSRSGRVLLEGPLSRLGQSTSLPFRTPLTLKVRLSRFFATATRMHVGVGDTPVGRVLQRAFPRINWEQGHVFIQRRWFRSGGPTQWYPANGIANLGLRRLGNGGWNLLPMPRSLNSVLGRHPWMSCGVGAGVAGGTAGLVGTTGYNAYLLAGESLGLGKDVIIIIIQEFPNE